MSKQQTADDLRAAAAYIDQHGWQQGMAINRDTGAACALGALGTVVGALGVVYSIEGVVPRFDMASRALLCYLKRQPDIYSIVGWNDMPTRVQADVTEALEKAAAWVEEQA